jgi:hypothetical protein
MLNLSYAQLANLDALENSNMSLRCVARSYWHIQSWSVMMAC